VLDLLYLLLKLFYYRREWDAGYSPRPSSSPNVVGFQYVKIKEPLTKNDKNQDVISSLAGNVIRKDSMGEDSKNGGARLSSEAKQIVGDGTKSYPSPPPSILYNSPPTGMIVSPDLSVFDKKEWAPDKGLSNNNVRDGKFPVSAKVMNRLVSDDSNHGNSTSIPKDGQSASVACTTDLNEHCNDAPATSAPSSSVLPFKAEM